MKYLYIISISLLILEISCSKKVKDLNTIIQNSSWLLYDFGDCKDILNFFDSTFELSSCETMDEESGYYWTIEDTILILIPKPVKEKKVIEGDTVEIYTKIHSIRPTLLKMYYKDEKIFYFQRIDNYKQVNQNIINNFKINVLTRIN